MEARVRFARYVDLDGPTPPHRPELGPCHVWTGGFGGNGYGVIWFQGRSHAAHRVAFFLAEGRWPEPCGLHHCDNPECVRREHLFEGTKVDNARDMDAKGRCQRAQGVAHGLSKLSPENVIAIRNASGTLRAIGAQFGLHHKSVRKIRRREAWAHIA